MTTATVPKKRRVDPLRWCLGILSGLLFVALVAPLIANHRPLYVKYKGESFFPAFSAAQTHRVGSETIDMEHADWKRFACERIIFPPVAWSPSEPDYANADYVAPGNSNYFRDGEGRHMLLPARFRHFLGTDKLGRDTLSGLIHGARISLSIGLLSMWLASLIGIGLGAVAGYFGDHLLKTERGTFAAVLAGLAIAFFIAFRARSYELADAWAHSPGSFFLQLMFSLALFTVIVVLFRILGKGISRIPGLGKQVPVRIDSLVSRSIEILISLPRLVLIIAIAAIARPSYMNLVLIIGLTAWTDIARLTRAEFLRLRNAGFIESARALGYSPLRIIVRHALPNAMAPVYVSIAFGIALAILVESSLSFLGAGVPQGVVTWGSMLAQGRENIGAWWLVVFPGAMIFIVVALFNKLGDALRGK